MTDGAGDVAAIGGSRPAETSPGASDTGPTGGGKAVPDDVTLTGRGGTLGDTASMDDGGLNSGTSLEEEDGATARPQASPAGAGTTLTEADAPTGGLSRTGTIGGSPTGTAASGFGDKGG